MNHTQTYTQHQTSWQPVLEDGLLLLRPLRSDDFEPLFRVAADPLLWEQHPAKERSTREGFEKFFAEALQTGMALVVIDRSTGEIIGTSRYNRVPESDQTIEIGWTFIARSHWGGQYNRALKKLMLDYAFQHIKQVLFFIHRDNLRSRKAVEKIGGALVTHIDGVKIDTRSEENVVYAISNYFEPPQTIITPQTQS